MYDKAQQGLGSKSQLLDYLGVEHKKFKGKKKRCFWGFCRERNNLKLSSLEKLGMVPEGLDRRAGVLPTVPQQLQELLRN